MGRSSGIEWTESTWNPVTGCTKVSPGCKNCYAERLALRLRAMGQPNYAKGFDLAIHPLALELPLHWKKPQVIFVNSMSDLFHRGIPLEYVQRVFDVMRRASWHTFQVLTKRSDRLAKVDPHLQWHENIWMGVSVESEQYLQRVDDLRRCHAQVKFLSLEPLLGPLPGLSLEGVDWVIVGGESGPGARPMDVRWVAQIQEMCKRARVPFFFKQWGGVQKSKAGRLLKGRTWDEMPVQMASRSNG